MDSDYLPVIGMIFSLLVLILIGGFILMFPISRRLAAYLEQRVSERSGARADASVMIELRETVEALRAEVRGLAERQEFVERLVEERTEREALPAGRGETTAAS